MKQIRREISLPDLAYIKRAFDSLLQVGSVGLLRFVYKDELGRPAPLHHKKKPPQKWDGPFYR